MHLDESTVAWFGWQLASGHGYAYDPVYHGPFQHEVLALMFLLFQSSETTARLPAVILGTGILILPWAIRDYIGTKAALISSFLLAVSPSFLYFARFERDDTYMEFFTFLMVVFALRYLRDHRPRQLYGFVLATALAFTTKESIYIVAFIFISYLVLWYIGSRQTVRRALTRVLRSAADGRLPAPIQVGAAAALLAALVLTLVTGLYLPVPAVAGVILCLAVLAVGTEERVQRTLVLRRAAKHHCLSALTLSLGLVVLMYSTFGTNLNGLWDSAHPLFNTNHACPYPLAFNLDACRKDMLGGLFYWLSQHKVARGGQPWFYYGLIYGLYEQVALIFASVAIISTFVSRSLDRRNRSIRLFFVYWAVVAFCVYSWAGEKFPWLGIHPLLPITLLAGIGLAGLLEVRIAKPLRWAALTATAMLLLLEVHNALTLSYVDGANPVEMMVYVQSAPDTPAVAHLIESLSYRARNAPTLPVTIDATDTWPFAWYLRNMTNIAYPTPTQTVKPPYVDNPVVVLDRGDSLTEGAPPPLARAYTRSLHRLDWWFPEYYKAWDWRTFLQAAINPSSWRSVWSWELFRKPFGPRDGTWFYLFVKRRYFTAF